MGSKSKAALSVFLIFILLPSMATGATGGSPAQVSSEPGAAVPVQQYNQDIEVTIPGSYLSHLQVWNGFKEGARPTDPPISISGEIRNSAVKLVFSPVGHTVTGTMSGAYSDAYSHVNLSYAGSISGVMEPEYWYGGEWQWNINATADITMTFSWGNATTSPVVWTTKTLPISVNFKIYALDRPDHTIISLSMYWYDYGGLGGQSRSFNLHTTGEGYNATRLPVPLDFDYSISGPDALTPTTPSAQFTVETTGEDADMVRNASWEFYYRNKYTEVWTLCSSFSTSAVGRVYKTDASPLTVSGSQIASWSQILQSHGVTQGGMKVLPMRVMITFYADSAGVQEMVRWEEWYNSTFDFYLQEQPSLSGQIVGMGSPVKHMKLEFRPSGGSTYTSVADSQGRFSVPVEASKSGPFTITITFAYQEDETIYFILHNRNTNTDPAADTTPPVALELTANGEAITAARFRISADSYENIAVPAGRTVSSINLDDYLTEANGIECYTGMYRHFTEALEFYRDYLGVDLTARAPLKVYTFVGKGTAYDHVGSLSYITINAGDSYQDSPNRPKNREYHEFSHYAMHCLYGDAFEYPAPATDYVNHGGFGNPTTIDSYQEGFAYFMSAIMGAYYGNYWDPQSNLAPDSLGAYGALDFNYKPWELEGRAEEKAIAGVLWDLYDSGREVLTTEASLCLAFFSTADMDNDLIINKTELLVLCMDTDYKAENWGEDGIFTGADLAGLAEKSGWGPGELEDRLLEHVGAELSITIPMLRLGHSTEELIKALLQAHDADNSGSLGLDELKGFTPPEGQSPDDYANTILSLFDSDDDGVLKGAEIAAIYAYQNIDQIGAVPLAAIMTLYGGTVPDEDDVEIDFSLLWDILKSPHRDFKSVYDALLREFPQLQEGIKKIFVAHGIFADTDRGDGAYNAGEPFLDKNRDRRYNGDDVFVDIPNEGVSWRQGEEIGRATNYERTARRSLVTLPGQFIKVNNTAPYYWMELTCLDPSVGEGFPIRFYRLQLMNINGSIYFPMPPEGYISWAKIYPADVTYGKPLAFTSLEFEESYLQAVQQGYFVQHDFRITGPVPSLPPIPGAGSVQPPANQTKSGCIIATATYGSEAAPQVQALRDFRDGIAMKTFAGSSFMTVFLTWYYSWSPPVAYSIAPDDNAKAVMRVALQPILDILQVATVTFSSLSFSGELAIVAAGFVAASLIGLVYIVPPATLAFLVSKRLRQGLALPSASRALRCTAIPWLGSVALIIIAEAALSPSLMMAATAAFVILTIAMTAGTASLWLAGLHRRG